MENVDILLNNEKINVNGIFYSYQSRYYLIYTQKEIDENGYVVLYLTQLAKDNESNEMIGLELSDEEQWKLVQTSITKIVDSKKNGVNDPEIKYFPMSMLGNVKILGFKTFRLLKNVIEDNFKLVIDDANIQSNIETVENNTETTEPIETNQTLQTPIMDDSNQDDMSNVIIDYRTKYFEEQEKNIELQSKIDNLKEQLNNIKAIIDNNL